MPPVSCLGRRTPSQRSRQDDDTASGRGRMRAGMPARKVHLGPFPPEATLIAIAVPITAGGKSVAEPRRGQKASGGSPMPVLGDLDKGRRPSLWPADHPWRSIWHCGRDDRPASLLPACCNRQAGCSHRPMRQRDTPTFALRDRREGLQASRSWPIRWRWPRRASGACAFVSISVVACHSDRNDKIGRLGLAGAEALGLDLGHDRNLAKIA